MGCISIILMLLFSISAHAGWMSCKSLGINETKECEKACLNKQAQIAYQNGGFGCITKSSSRPIKRNVVKKVPRLNVRKAIRAAVKKPALVKNKKKASFRKKFSFSSKDYNNISDNAVKVDSSGSDDFNRLKEALANSAGSNCVQKKMKEYSSTKTKAEMKAMGMKLMGLSMKFAKECMCSDSSKEAHKEIDSILESHPSWRGKEIKYQNNYLDLSNNEEMKMHFEKNCK